LETLAGTEAGCSRAIDFRRTEEVVVVDHLRSRGLLKRNDIREWHQPARFRAYIILPQIACRHAERFISLHVDAVRTIVEVEIVHVLRSHVDAKGLRNLADWDTHRLSFFSVYLDQLLRVVGG